MGGVLGGGGVGFGGGRGEFYRMKDSLGEVRLGIDFFNRAGSVVIGNQQRGLAMDSYTQGYKAMEAGKDMEANPFDYWTDRTNWRDWNDGFLRATFDKK